jgi:hypothetical protein
VVGFGHLELGVSPLDLTEDRGIGGVAELACGLGHSGLTFLDLLGDVPQPALVDVGQCEDPLLDL